MLGESWGVLKQDKELLIFPFISLIALLALLAAFAFPIYLEFTGTESLAEKRALADQLLSQEFLIPFFIYLLVTTFVMVYFQSALIGCAMMRLEGGDPKVRDGFRIANSNIVNILFWSLISATISFIFHVLSALTRGRGAASWVIRFLIGAVEFAWAILTYLVIPIYVAEKISPLEAIKRSSSLLKETWGEQLVGEISLGFIFFFLGLLALPLVVFGGLNGMIATGLYALVLATIWSALSGIYRAGIYQYAVTGKISTGFSENTMTNAFYKRRGAKKPSDKTGFINHEF